MVDVIRIYQCHCGSANTKATPKWGGRLMAVKCKDCGAESEFNLTWTPPPTLPS